MTYSRFPLTAVEVGKASPFETVSTVFDMSLTVNQRKLEATEALAHLAEDAGMTLIELAIAFALNHPAVTSVLIGPRTLQHLETQLPAISLGSWLT